MVSWWPGNGNANDAAGANHGAREGGVGFASGKAGQAFSFDGTPGLVRVRSASSLNPTGSLTLVAWIYPTDDIFGHIVVKWGDAGAWSDQRAYSFHTLPGRGLRFAISDAAHQSDGSFQYFDTSSVLTLNAWNFVAAVYDQSTGKRHLYVNDRHVNERTDPPITLTASIADLGIGAQPNEPGSSLLPFKGRIDEVQIYNRPLGAAEILAIFRCATEADVSVSKHGPEALQVPAGEIKYLILVGNEGPDEARDVTLTDPTPVGFTLISVTGDCTTLPCTLSLLPAYTNKSVEVRYRLAPELRGKIVNIALVSSATDRNSANNTAVATTFLCPTAAPDKVLPLDGARSVPTSGTLFWADVGAASYTVFLDEAGRGAGKFFGSTTARVLLYSGLRPGTTYEWRVEAISHGCPPKISPFFTFTTGKPLLKIEQKREVIDSRPPGMGFIDHAVRWFRTTYTLTITNVGDGDTEGPIEVASTLGPLTRGTSGRMIRLFRSAPGFHCPTSDFPRCTTNEVLKPGEPKTLQVDLEEEATAPMRIEHRGTVNGGGAPDAISNSDVFKIDGRFVPLPPNDPKKTTGRERPK